MIGIMKNEKVGGKKKSRMRKKELHLLEGK